MRKVALVPAKAQALLDQVGVRASAGEPVAVFGYYDATDEARRIVARYADGWRADLRFHADGSYSLTQSKRLRVIAAKPTQEVAIHG